MKIQRAALGDEAGDEEGAFKDGCEPATHYGLRWYEIDAFNS